mgnify:CR=1 FL=1|tara:strand:+ start:38 stop:496 length:459 start_codon:yes stop_codon:yes gene_type:complete
MKNITNINLDNLDETIVKNNLAKTITKKVIVENKVALSLREFNNTKLLFRLVNTKRNNTKSYDIYEKSRLSTSIKEAFNNDYRYIDITYDTTKNNRFKKVNLLVDSLSYLDKSKKNLYLDLLNSNDIFIKNNKVSKEIIENTKYFRDKINSL